MHLLQKHLLLLSLLLCPCFATKTLSAIEEPKHQDQKQRSAPTWDKKLAGRCLLETYSKFTPLYVANSKIPEPQRKQLTDFMQQAFDLHPHASFAQTLHQLQGKAAMDSLARQVEPDRMYFQGTSFLNTLISILDKEGDKRAVTAAKANIQNNGAIGGTYLGDASVDALSKIPEQELIPSLLALFHSGRTSYSAIEKACDLVLDRGLDKKFGKLLIPIIEDENRSVRSQTLILKCLVKTDPEKIKEKLQSILWNHSSGFPPGYVITDALKVASRLDPAYAAKLAKEIDTASADLRERDRDEVVAALLSGAGKEHRPQLLQELEGRKHYPERFFSLEDLLEGDQAKDSRLWKVIQARPHSQKALHLLNQRLAESAAMKNPEAFFEMHKWMKMMVDGEDRNLEDALFQVITSKSTPEKYLKQAASEIEKKLSNPKNRDCGLIISALSLHPELGFEIAPEEAARELASYKDKKRPTFNWKEKTASSKPWTLGNGTRIPEQVDLNGQFPNFARQQKYGTCHIYAATALMEAACFKKTGKRVNLSEAYLVYRHLRESVHKQGDNLLTSEGKNLDTGNLIGGYPIHSLSRIFNRSICQEHCFPFDDDFAKNVEHLFCDPISSIRTVSKQQEDLASQLAGKICSGMDAHVKCRKLKGAYSEDKGWVAEPDSDTQECLNKGLIAEEIPYTQEKALELLSNQIPFICSGSTGLHLKESESHAVVVTGYKIDKINYDSGNTQFTIRDSNRPPFGSFIRSEKDSPENPLCSKITYIK